MRDGCAERTGQKMDLQERSMTILKSGLGSSPCNPFEVFGGSRALVKQIRERHTNTHELLFSLPSKGETFSKLIRAAGFRCSLRAFPTSSREPTRFQKAVPSLDTLLHCCHVSAGGMHHVSLNLLDTLFRRYHVMGFAWKACSLSGTLC